VVARRRDGETSRWDWVALVIPLTIGLLTWMNGINVLRSGRTSQDGVPVGMMFFFGSICLLAAAGDVRILLHGGVSGPAKGTRRLVRSGSAGVQREADPEASQLSDAKNNVPRLRCTVGDGGHHNRKGARWLARPDSQVHHGTRRLRLSVTQSKFGRMRSQKESTRQRLVPSGA
jgi:hypothetical protein